MPTPVSRQAEASALLTRPSIDTSVPIFVLSLAPDPRHHGPVHIARSAGRIGIDVYGVHRERLAPAALSRYMRRSLILPREASAQEWLRNLRRVGAQHGRVVLVPIDDAGATFVDEHADALSAHFLFPRRPAEINTILGSKRELHLLALRLGIPSPGAAFPDNEREALADAQRLGYPVVLKRISGSATAAGATGASVSIAADSGELRRLFASMRGDAAHTNVMLQEHIPGPSASVCMFNGYFDARSEALVRFTGRKLRQRPPYTGATTLGVCAWNEEVDRESRRLLREVAYRGIVDLGFRFDSRDGRYKLLDVNPRIGATFRLFVGENGIDVLRALYLDLTGQPVPQTRQLEGRRWLVEPSDLSSSLVYWRDDVLSPREWARSLADVRETAWWASDDPLPAVGIAADVARGHVARLIRDVRESRKPADSPSSAEERKPAEYASAPSGSAAGSFRWSPAPERAALSSRARSWLTEILTSRAASRRFIRTPARGASVMSARARNHADTQASATETKDPWPTSS